MGCTDATKEKNKEDGRTRKPTDVYLYEGIGQKKIVDVKMTDVNYISYDMPIKVNYLSPLLH